LRVVKFQKRVKISKKVANLKFLRKFTRQNFHILRVSRFLKTSLWVASKICLKTPVLELSFHHTNYNFCFIFDIFRVINFVSSTTTSWFSTMRSSCTGPASRARRRTWAWRRRGRWRPRTRWSRRPSCRNSSNSMELGRAVKNRQRQEKNSCELKCRIVVKLIDMNSCHGAHLNAINDHASGNLTLRLSCSASIYVFPTFLFLSKFSKWFAFAFLFLLKV